MSKIFVIPPDVLRNLSDPPPSPSSLIIKTTELASVFEAEIDHPLGLLKVKAVNFRGIIMVVRVKLEKTDKNPTASITFMLLTKNLADNFP